MERNVARVAAATARATMLTINESAISGLRLARPAWSRGRLRN
jgi:hypothetical protein